MHKTDFQGISFSGGDPLIESERLLEWLKYFKKNLPDYYFWVYTSGIGVDEKILRRLNAEGMNEIRFNTAATGYLSTRILDLIGRARDIFQVITVEIPSIKEDYHRLTISLPLLNDIGVDFLTLHEYIKEERIYATDEETYAVTLNKTIPLRVAKSSSPNTKKVIEQAKIHSYSFHINDCNIRKKEKQMLRRRISMAQLLSNPSVDLIDENGIISNFYCFPGNTNLDQLRREAISPEFERIYVPFIAEKSLQTKFTDPNPIRIRIDYLPPMDIFQKKQFIGLYTIE